MNDQSSHAKVSRRQFLKASATAGGGFSLSVFLPGCAVLGNKSLSDEGRWTANAWLEITPESEVVFTLDRVEMGQGTTTGLTTLVAEELNIAPDTVTVIYAPVANDYRNPEYGLQMTGGSNSLSTSWGQIREAAATVREMLMAAAAEVHQVPVKQCQAVDGVVLVEGSNKRLRYGELASLAASQSIPSNPRLKAASEFRFIGKQNKRVDIADKVNGRTEYGIDTEVPGMAYAVISRSPVLGGKVLTFDATKALDTKGVVAVFEVYNGIAVVAEQYWQARKAQQKLEIEWEEGPLATLSSDEMFQSFKKTALEDDGKRVRDDGDFDDAVDAAARVIEVEYQTPFLAHATLEPMNCVVEVNEDRANVWAPTQAPDLARIAVARVTDLSPDDVDVNVTAIGGGFGRRLTQDFIEEAAAVAVQAKRPIKLMWSREEDTQHDWYRPATYHKFKATFDKSGSVTGWDHQIVAPNLLDWYIRDAAPAQYPWAPKFMYGTLGSIGLAMQGIAVPKDETAIEGAVSMPYNIANIQVRHTHADIGVPVSFWRSVGHSQNAFYVESFIDELAHETSTDPVLFRQSLLKDQPRQSRVLELAAEQSGWGKPLPEGRFRGVAVHKSFKSYAAQVVELSVEDGAINVHRVVCAIDCGTVVNPDIVKAQMEGGIIFALTAALYGEISVKNGRVEQSNFDDYKLLRMNETPVIDVHIVESTESPTGVGEPGVPPLAPAVANAIFAATGNRLRSLPLRLT
ncbi:xanthine dehydrogenase family protein molybdopterin-binding subunit [Alkalimarinus sediminis]|uniref:Xanthine dehydrogenase family protein molybdopterin-binding subunit n=1 Tax=Alkalimarinus sediminis TaxID=1632866 RepID=A0A9E8HGU2_9ALTE|nr:xanthine dehydrogenase family protein molybdopterin-binding subunit [Alkalimarinus sediminis]UZW74169.1 xanthine dehydrogenase family protein molybdopterin-binding subunit [Alkalimarinus sediminis]